MPVRLEGWVRVTPNLPVGWKVRVRVRVRVPGMHVRSLWSSCRRSWRVFAHMLLFRVSDTELVNSFITHIAPIRGRKLDNSNSSSNTTKD